MFPNHDQKSQKSQRGPVPACLKRQPITWQILLLGLRFPSGLLSPMNWPAHPPSSPSGLSITLQGKDGHFGKQGRARQRHDLRKTVTAGAPSMTSPIFFNLSLPTGSFNVEHKCVQVLLYFTIPALPSISFSSCHIYFCLSLHCQAARKSSCALPHLSNIVSLFNFL